MACQYCRGRGYFQIWI
ncbi:hypothetical protein IV493_03730 [Pantoea sp. SM3640]|nr:hypothetical protein IV493_03730 [Pantoea sp. SM3640]